MLTYDELVLAYRHLQELASFVAVFLIGIAIVLAILPIGTCPECAHCRLERLDDAWCPQHNGRKRYCKDEHRP